MYLEQRVPLRQKRIGEAKPASFSSRQFVRGLFVTGIDGGLDTLLPTLQGEVFQKSPALLTGNRFDLEIDSDLVNITGRQSRATLVNGSLPAPTMKWREGDLVTVAVTNRLKKPTSIHWHGVRVPPEMDGVPGLSFEGIPPGETFVYRIPVRQSGTYWYHSHSGNQEQTGLAGALIVEPRQGDSIEYDREYVIFLTDWTDTNPDTIFHNLKEDSEYYNYSQRTAGTFLKYAKRNGIRPMIFNRRMWGGTNTPTDISDTAGSTYAYLLNGCAPATNRKGVFSAGERVRLRFINGSAMTFFDVRVPGLSMTVVQADGNNVEPVVVDEFRIGNAETYDVIVSPNIATAYTIFAQAADRSGYARGTLAPAIGATATVPKLDPRPLRTVVNMGMTMNMTRMPSGGHSGVVQENMSGMDMDNKVALADKAQTSRRLLLTVILVAMLTCCAADAQMQWCQRNVLGAPNNPRWKAPVKNEVVGHLLFNQLEGRTDGPGTEFRWDGEAWIGTDMNRLWIKSEGVAEHESMSDGDHEVLYDRPIPRIRYFDLQAGVRADLDSGPRRIWGAAGIEGIAPDFLQLETTFYFRDEGRIAGKVATSYDLKLTQRLVAQLQAELNFYGQPDPARGLGTGLTDLDTAFRLRYEIRRKLAPYVGYSFTNQFGSTAAASKRSGEPVSHQRFVFGLRTRF